LAHKLIRNLLVGGQLDYQTLTEVVDLDEVPYLISRSFQIFVEANFGERLENLSLLNSETFTHFSDVLRKLLIPVRGMKRADRYPHHTPYALQRLLSFYLEKNLR
jgi:hypothetical protein